MKMSDLVSRRDALDAICDNCETVNADCAHFPCARYLAIEKLPAVEERPHGRWIMHIDEEFLADSFMECDQCHEEQPLTCDDNYCPNCGARMEGEA